MRAGAKGRWWPAYRISLSKVVKLNGVPTSQVMVVADSFDHAIEKLRLVCPGGPALVVGVSRAGEMLL